MVREDWNRPLKESILVQQQAELCLFLLGLLIKHEDGSNIFLNPVLTSRKVGINLHSHRV
jgi:hypothetical protein